MRRVALHGGEEMHDAEHVDAMAAAGSATVSGTNVMPAR